MQRAPDAIAVEWDGEELTYLAVDRRANQLARHLRRLGAGAEVPVGVCLERSAQMVIAWIAILKAGGAYVHLDPDYPADRLGFMMADSGASVLITVERLAGVVPGVHRRVELDRDAAAIAALDAGAVDNQVGPDSLAYIVYTSGSTGKPKGIATSHTALVRLVVNTDFIPYAPEDRIAQASNASFDLIKPELWGALLNGARLIGIPKAVLLSPAELVQALARHRITVLILPTALFNQIARTLPAALVLTQHPAVALAVAVAREDRPGDKRLVAYAVPASDRAVDGAELRRFLQNRLPDYMVPSAVMVLDELPLNANGKVDRKALPPPVGSRGAADRVAPRSALEARLAAVWAEILAQHQPAQLVEARRRRGRRTRRLLRALRPLPARDPAVRSPRAGARASDPGVAAVPGADRRPVRRGAGARRSRFGAGGHPAADHRHPTAVVLRARSARDGLHLRRSRAPSRRRSARARLPVARLPR